MVEKNSLIILGNGFDLNCKLKSSFSAFFKTKFEEVVKAVDTCYIDYTCSNIWYLLLYFRFFDDRYFLNEQYRIFEKMDSSNPLWMNVEEFIKIIVSSNKKLSLRERKMISPFHDYLDLLSIMFAQRKHAYVRGDINQYSAIKKFFRLRFQNKEPINESNFEINDFLYEELLDFENDFKHYLIEETNKEVAYKTFFDKLLKNIIDINKEMFSVISFNYTPFLGGTSLKKRLLAYYNIHGELKNQIIIGFDSSDIDINQYSSIKMCKAWQKMNVGGASFKLPNKDSVNSIKIYGHSLGEQDYSYFHAIFDYYNIYNSNVILNFYYTEYEDAHLENIKIRNKYISNVFKLLNDYAEKSGNEEKAKTIVSRLQLENRLIILPIPKIDNIQ